jgi:hypothetical protein
MRRTTILAAMLVLTGAISARAQVPIVPDVVGVPAQGDPTGRRLGYMLSNGFGYGGVGPGGPGYYTGIGAPPAWEDGFSPYYNPIFNAMNTGPGSFVPLEKRGTTLLGRTLRRVRRHRLIATWWLGPLAM